MSLFEIFLLSIALGIDCAIVSFSQGLIFRENRIKNALILSASMGLFQGFMPVIGNFATNYMRDFIGGYAKYITIVIFLLLGLEFILNALNKTQKHEELKCMSLKCIIALSIATSIDALLSGVTLNLTYSNNLSSYLTIGIVSFIMAFTSFWLTGYINSVPTKKMQIIGGFILIFLGVKVFFF